MLRATGIEAYDVDFAQIRSDVMESHERDAIVQAPRLFICCVDHALSTVGALRSSAGFQLAASAASDGITSLTIRHCVDGGSMGANRSAEYVSEVAAHIFEFPPPHPAVIHLDLHRAPGFRRVQLACVAEAETAFTFPVGTHHLTLTPFALENTRIAPLRIWASNLFEKLFHRETTSLGCACCTGTAFFTRLIHNERNCENDEN